MIADRPDCAIQLTNSIGQYALSLRGDMLVTTLGRPTPRSIRAPTLGKPSHAGSRTKRRCLPPIPSNKKRAGGIENLLPDDVIEDRFFSEEKIQSGSDNGFVRRLQKTTLCDFLCLFKRSPPDSENFRAPLAEIRNTLLLEADPE
jgi:hypothetical protein